MVNYSWNAMVSFSTGSGAMPVAPPATMPLPTALSLKQFMKWSADDQIAYIEAKGTGSPKKVTIGDPGDVGDPGYPKPTFTLGYTLSTPPKLDFSDLVPADIDPDDFVTWTRDNQLGFIAEHDDDADGVVSLGGPTNGAIARVLPTGVLEMIAAGVLHPTASEPIPYHHLSGSAGGTPSTVVSTSAEWLFPTLDGDEFKLPVSERPAGFDTAPSSLPEPSAFTDDAEIPPGLTAKQKSDAAKKAFLDDFGKWHSAYQLEYVKTYGTGTPKAINIQDSNLQSLMNALVSRSDPSKLIIVQSLDKAAIARMTKNEQEDVSESAAFAQLKAALGLALVTDDSIGAHGPSQNGGSFSLALDPATKMQTPVEYIDELIKVVAFTRAPNKGGVALPPKAINAFVDQLKILKEQLGNSVIISPADIQNKVDELRERFDRLFAFYNVTEPTAHTYPMGDPDDKDVTVYEDVISLKGDISGVNRGYSVFLAQELRIAELAEARMRLVRDNGIFNGKTLDVPYLVYKFQSLYNLSLEAQVVAETEEVNQKNDLLKTYAAIQDIINRTLAGFEKNDSPKRGVLGWGVDSTWRIGVDEMKILSMFENSLGTNNGGQKHPLEVLESISRPLAVFFDTSSGGKKNYDTNQYSYGQWSQVGTRLSETVTLINQNSQIKMNDINSMDKERNRHFELANNALAKMADIIANIARAA